MWKDLWDTAISELTRAKVDRRHPFRYFSLGTLGHNFPELRTVVLRDFDKQRMMLYLYTDSRTPKVKQIADDPNISCLFYHLKKQLQVRIRCKAQLIDEQSELYQNHLQKIKSSKSIQDYTTSEAPGARLDEHDVIYDLDYVHFTLIECCIVDFDILQLSRDGHKRCMVERLEDGVWRGIDLIP